jgi:uncharacterized protein (TIGR00730 family)
LNVTVFCSCSEGVSPLFLVEAENLGAELARLGHTVVYGGSNGGCMGALAQGTLSEGGRLVGVIPELGFMDGQHHDGLTEKLLVPTMAARKTAMIEMGEAFLIFPGGVGTLDEAFEVLALKNIGAIQGPILFYNFLDVWTPLLDAMELMVEQNLIRKPLNQMLRVLDKASELRENLEYAL